MKKILIATSKYLPNPSANGINVKYIIDELNLRGYDTSCMSIQGEFESNYEETDRTRIYRIKPSHYSKLLAIQSSKNTKLSLRILLSLAKIFRKIKLLILIPFFPNFDLYKSRKAFKKMEELYLKENFECIVATFKPYYNIAALKKMKKKYPEIVCVGYYLDLLNSMKKPGIMPIFLYEYLIKREIKISAEIFDLSLVAVSGKKQYKAIKEIDFENKVRFVDFPTFISKDNGNKLNYDLKPKTDIVFTYAGTLDMKYRNPEVLLKMLESISNESGSIILNVYGINDCANLFSKYEHIKGIKINNFGMRDHAEVLNSLREADYLINVSNKIQDAIPSKIFELFSIGKPIINLCFDPNDRTIEYFEKYPLVYNIYEWEDFGVQRKTFINFLSCNRDACIDTKSLEEVYKENRPSYTVDFIEEVLSKRGKILDS